MQASLWSRFQGIIYGSLLGERLAVITKHRLHKLHEIRIKLFECLVYSRTLEWNILESEEKIIKDLTVSELGILVIPVILFFQENPRKLSQYLDSLGLYLGKTRKDIEIMQTWSGIIALILRNDDWDEKIFFPL